MASSPLLRRTNNTNSASSLRNYNSIQRNATNYNQAIRSTSTQYTPLSPSTTNTSHPVKRKPSNKSPHVQSHIKRDPKVDEKFNIEDDKLSSKLGTLNGVTLPTILNVLSILMFLRFGFIIGQMGILGTIFLLLISYGIDLLTTLSISAIATNGIVKGGGAYYMLSRSLGVEFGGAIGVIFYIGQILNSSMNVAGVIEPLLYNFSAENGVLLKLLPTSYWWQFTYCSIFLLLCIVVALIGSSAVSKAGTYLCIILLLSTLSIPLSALFVQPFDSDFGFYTGLSWNTWKDNLFPHFTKGAAGSQMNGIETFNDLFGIFFPATAGILAGASMSGDLENPSKSIPNGTLNGLVVTFSSYLLVILSMGASIPRSLLHKDTQILQTINISPFIILAGEMSTSIFSIIVGIVGAAKLLQAIARDEILPGLKIFGNGDKNDDPKEAIILTWIICQLFLFADLNQIATLITMAFLMTFIVTNMSCALLKIGSAPNFRPSFKYFSTKSALAGTISCFVAMFIVDGLSASIVLVTLFLLILVIHFVSPPKTWGDVSQSLIYHQVRKYLLKLRQDNVKYWRPQILLLVDNPRTSWKLITFCNNLKKGGLYILGHVFVVTSNFQDNATELVRSKENWIKIRDITKVKAFVQISIAPSFTWGVRNIFLGSGLGGMKPNITIIAFYDLARYKGTCNIPKGIKYESLTTQFQKQVKIDLNNLPTDKRAKFAPKIKITEWIQVLEDLSLLNSNIAVAKGFPRLDIPIGENKYQDKKCIDLYPIQMAQRLDSDEGVLTTNFDTCTLILQMGAILHTVPNWKHTHTLRVVVFVESETDVYEEHIRVQKLLEILRMQEAKIVVICLENANLKIYNYLSKGIEEGLNGNVKKRINELLNEDVWWNEVVNIRSNLQKNKNDSKNISIPVRSNSVGMGNFSLSAPLNTSGNAINRSLNKLKNMEGSGMRRMTMSKVNQLGISFGTMNFQPNRFSSNEINGVINAGDEFTDTDVSYSDIESIQSSDSHEIDNYSGSTNSAHNNNNKNNCNSANINDHNNLGYNHVPPQNTSGSSVLLERPEFQQMLSSGSLRKMKKSAFTAERMPNSTIKENAEGNEASIMFENESDGNENVIRKKVSRTDSEMRIKTKGKVKEQAKAKAKDKDKDKEKERGVSEEVEDIKEYRGNTIGSNNSVNSINNNSERGSNVDCEEGNVQRKKSSTVLEGSSDMVISEGVEGVDEEIGEDLVDEADVVGEEVDEAAEGNFAVKFGDMTRRCQFLILNEMMKDISGECTDLIFSTLPVPEVGLHHNEVESVDYVVDLELWTEGLPAILLMNAKTVTVTSNL